MILVKYVFVLLSLGVTTPARDSVMSLEALKAHVYKLADDALEGRMTGEAGERLATEYAANFFKQHGLLPGGTAGGFFQEFPLTYGGEAGPGCTLKVTNGDGSLITGKAGEDFNPVYGSVENRTIEGSLVFAGEGIVSETRNDFAGVDASGKIVVLFPAAPRDRIGNAARARNAEERGAVGVIFAGPTEEGAYKMVRVTRQRGIARGSKVVAISITADFFEKISGMNYKRARAEAAAGRVETGFPSNVSAVMCTEIVPRRVVGRNVIGILLGNDATLRNQYVIIGAHIDHIGWGDVASLSNTEKIHNGADDNASGTAVVLELARYFAQSKSNKRTLVFQLYSGEELGLVGAAYFVKNPTIDLKAVAAMLNLDMVGNVTDGKLEVYGLGTSPTWSQVIKKESEGLRITGIERISPDSDHWVFYQAGIPALAFFSGYHNRYHRDTDEADKLNYEGMVLVGNMVADLLRSLDSLTDMPAFQKGSEVITRKPPEERPREAGRKVRVGLIPEYGDAGPGLLLAGVSDNSPAQKAGLLAGDRILKWGDIKIESIEDLQEIFTNAEAGKPVELTVVRDGKEMKIIIVPEAIG